MAFRYINPGYVYLLDSNVTATQYTGYEYSRTGVAFTQTKEKVGVTLPDFAEGDDFWAKFDVYIPTDVAICVMVLAPNVNSCGFEVACPANKSSTHYLERVDYDSSTYRTTFIATGTAADLGIVHGAINSFAMQMKYGDSNTAFIKIWVNSTKTFLRTGPYSITYSRSMPKVAQIFSWSKYKNELFSSVIFSNEEISTKEQAIRLPISATATDMTAGASGIYTATAIGQTLLQTPDITGLSEFSKDSKITGIQIVGNPAYKNSTGLETMIGLSKSGTVETEHDSFMLGTDSTAIITDGWGLSGVTLAGLSTMQFGWKTAY